MSPTTGVECPSCEAVGKLVLISPDYDGPYACWKCRSVFNIAIGGGRVPLLCPRPGKKLTGSGSSISPALSNRNSAHCGNSLAPCSGQGQGR